MCVISSIELGTPCLIDTEGFLCLCSEGLNEEGPHIESFQPSPNALFTEPDWLMDKSQ